MSNEYLLKFAEEGATAQVRDIIEKGANVNTRDDDGETALIYAAQKEHADIVRLLIEAGADVNATTGGGFSALIYSARNGDTESVKLLLGKGANVNIATNRGATALSLAILYSKDLEFDKRQPYSEIITLLKQAGAK
ncbi:MAG: ankyrin repeat domain-containing protein [Nitrospirae bacterium]|nr:ankyrin repeat domain-containing protein [Nitrospirota bacterium]